MNNTKITDIYPQICVDFYQKNAPFIRKIVSLNITTNEDILSDIYLLYAEHRLTVNELAKLYKVRKIGGIWCQIDPIGHATSLAQLEEQGFDVIDRREDHFEEPQHKLPAGVIASTRELSDKLHLTMRRAQQIVAEQIADLKAGNDLFGLGV